MLLFVIPMFQGIYKRARRHAAGADADPDQHLERLPQVLVRRSSSCEIGGGVRRSGSGSTPKRAASSWDAIKLKVPVFGKLSRKTALARFSRTLSALVRSGVPILESLDIVRGDRRATRSCRDAVRDTQSG